MDLWTEHRSKAPMWVRKSPQMIIGVSTLLLLMTVWTLSSSSSSSTTTTTTMQPAKIAQRITVYMNHQDSATAHKQQYDLMQVDAADTVLLEPQVMTLQQQGVFVRAECNKYAARFEELVKRQQEHLATELWKYCAMHQFATSPFTQPHEAVAFCDSNSPFLVRLQDFLTARPKQSIAVLGDAYFPESIHGSLLVLRKEQGHVAEKMLDVLLYTPYSSLETNPILIPRTLHGFIAADVTQDLGPGENGDHWYLLEQKCHLDPLRRADKGWADTHSYRVTHYCPETSGYCCSVMDVADTQVVLMSRHPVLPFQKLPTDLPVPYNKEAGHYQEDELPFIATIQEEVLQKPENAPDTPNFFDVLLANDCLPSDDQCSRCLHNKRGADCQTCRDVCPCFCKALCHEKVDTKFVSKELTITPPIFARDPNRLVPRIVHQTWFEELTPEKYPNISRLVESFRGSGWEYRFYSDDDASNFLSTHFPAEVREAYDALVPGAFKADLFRYCVLLIHGGIYADVDIMLETSLDAAVAPEIGFMAPIDEPGTAMNKRFCLWNGLIAAAPGHPFLAKAVEIVVNQVRNRFTSVDVDATFCPNPEMSILHAFDTLHTAGPCLLGSAINRVLGHHGQNPIASGELQVPTEAGLPPIPGRAVILHQNKWDMGAHRFTLEEQNLVVAATDLPDSNDREKTQSNNKAQVHYSKTHAKTGIYGLENLYTDKVRANEDIRIKVGGPQFGSGSAVTKEA